MQMYGTAEKKRIRSVVPEPVKNCCRIKKLIATKTSKRIEMIIKDGVLILFFRLWMRKFWNVPVLFFDILLAPVICHAELVSASC